MVTAPDGPWCYRDDHARRRVRRVDATGAAARTASGGGPDLATRCGAARGGWPPTEGSGGPEQEGDVLSLDRNGRCSGSPTSARRVVEATPALDALRRPRRRGEDGHRADRTSGAPTVARSRATTTSRPVALAGRLALAGDHAGPSPRSTPRTGRRRWSVRFDGRLWSAPRSTRRGLVVATWHGSTASPVRVFDLATGALRWEAPTRSVHRGAGRPRNGRVFLATGDCQYHARVEALEPRRPARWRGRRPCRGRSRRPSSRSRTAMTSRSSTTSASSPCSTPAGPDPVAAHPAAGADRHPVPLTARRVVLTSFSGTVFVLDRATGPGDHGATARAGSAGIRSPPPPPRGAARPRSSSRSVWRSPYASSCDDCPEGAGEARTATMPPDPSSGPGSHMPATPRSPGLAPVPAGRGTTEEQIVRAPAHPGSAEESRRPSGCANEKDNPWQKQRLSSR